MGRPTAVSAYPASNRRTTPAVAMQKLPHLNRRHHSVALVPCHVVSLGARQDRPDSAWLLACVATDRMRLASTRTVHRARPAPAGSSFASPCAGGRAAVDAAASVAFERVRTAALGRHFLDIPVGQTGTQIPAHRDRDDLAREALTGRRRRVRPRIDHPISLAAERRPDKRNTPTRWANLTPRVLG